MRVIRQSILFAVGVATGIVMEFQFGTNWSEYSKFVGDIFGDVKAPTKGIKVVLTEESY